MGLFVSYSCSQCSGASLFFSQQCISLCLRVSFHLGRNGCVIVLALPPAEVPSLRSLRGEGISFRRRRCGGATSVCVTRRQVTSNKCLSWPVLPLLRLVVQAAAKVLSSLTTCLSAHSKFNGQRPPLRVVAALSENCNTLKILEVAFSSYCVRPSRFPSRKISPFLGLYALTLALKARGPRRPASFPWPARPNL